MTKHALIVDDCSFTVKFLSRCLSDLGFSVENSSTGELALQKLTNGFNADLIVIDWVMPGMSGVDLLSWLRSQERFATTPILMVTAQGALENIEEALNKGADEYVIKPFSKESIAEKLHLVGISIPRL